MRLTIQGGKSVREGGVDPRFERGAAGFFFGPILNKRSGQGRPELLKWITFGGAFFIRGMLLERVGRDPGW